MVAAAEAICSGQGGGWCQEGLGGLTSSWSMSIMDACVRIPALADCLPSPCRLVVGLESADELAHTREAEQAWPCCPGSILRSGLRR